MEVSTKLFPPRVFAANFHVCVYTLGNYQCAVADHCLFFLFAYTATLYPCLL